MDPTIAEAILRTLRMLTLITGTLVLIDSIGILVAPREEPPHKPKWAALSWCIIAATAAIVTGYLLSVRAGMVGRSDPFYEQLAVCGLYIGLTTGFTCRAISRAHRPWFTVAAVIGLSIAGVLFALRDVTS